ncbi:MAG TPA: chemotaxis protein CheW [Steroidobacteraceae bacterium]|nr:chemotaxis protein CheW [Steroidobacteraceae bacterium]
MSAALKAWKLQWPGTSLALAQCEVIEVVEEPEVYDVPLGPHWCRGLLHWRGQLIPLAFGGLREAPYVVVVAYQTAPKQPLQFAALGLTSVPKMFEVPADADRDPPPSCELREEQIRACLEHDGETLIVPELHRLFAQPDSTA